MISIKLFGKLAVVGPGGEPIAISGAKAQSLIAYLALNTGMPPLRDRLMTLFWGDRFTEQARQSLRQAISKLRRTFEAAGEDAIITDGDRVGLNPDSVRVDVDKFTHLAIDASPDAAIEAVEMMEGPLLDGLYGQQSEFEDWIVSERQRVATMACRVFERAAEAKMQRGDAGAALEIARRLVAIDPLRDISQVVLIRILAQSGERAAAIQHYNTYEEQLQAELGVDPGNDLKRLISEIRGESFMKPVEKQFTAPQYGYAKVAVADGDRASIAVIPFATLTPGPEQEYFVEGLAQDITTNLSRFRWLDVRAGPRLEGSRLTAADLSALGSDLGLDYVVHGSLRTHGPMLRLTVQLAEPSTSRYLWVTRYDRKSKRLNDVLDQLSETIAASVEAEMERLAGKAVRALSIEEMSAWDCYHRGLAIQYEFNADTNTEAQSYFRRAIELDPNFAAAYARLSYAMVISAIYFEAGNVSALLDEALDLARQSCKLDPDDAVGRFALGRVYLARGEYDRSLAELKTAIQLNPNLAQAHCALGDSLAYAGELENAMPCFDEAVRLSPLDPYRWAFLGYGATALLFKGDFPAAADWAERAEAVPNSHYWATAIRASALGNMGETEKARQAVAELRERRPGINCAFIRERLFYLRDPGQMAIYIGGLKKAGLD